MGRIQTLSDDVIGKIAAGEVVERPASVVKELVENAIDAGAAAVQIDIAGGGADRIVVTDDGCGMDAEDLGRSVLRHATSKIREEADLWRISTLGFRGEALASISAVARLTIASKPNLPHVIEGARLDVEGGVVSGPAPAGCAAGTRIEVRDLFFNVPARRKFLRSAGVEAGHVVAAVEGLALAFPRVRFDLTSDGARRLAVAACDASSEEALRHRIASVLGGRLRERWQRVNERLPEIAVHGWVAEGGRSGGKDVHVFLNQRPIRDRVLLHAIAEGVGEHAPGQAAAVLWIDIDPAQVDVNVHPQKREVRFQKSGAVHDLVRAAIRKAMARVPSIAAGELLSQPAGAESSTAEALLRYEEGRLGRAGYAVHAPSVRGAHAVSRAFEGPSEGAPTDASDESSLAPEGTAEESLRPIGQFGSSYIACEDPDGSLVLIDQHAAHERLGFDHLWRTHRAGGVAQQRLLLPEHLELGAKESAYVLERLESLAQAGFEIEPFGGTSIVIKAVPEILGDVALTPVFERLARELEEVGAHAAVEEVLGRIFAVVACHRQVRAGDALRPAEIANLVRDVERGEVTTCPHGRPAVVRIERTEIEKWFRRR